MRVFNPDRFFKRRTIFSSKNFGPGDQNFQDQNSRDRAWDMNVRNVAVLDLMASKESAFQCPLVFSVTLSPVSMVLYNGGGQD